MRRECFGSGASADVVQIERKAGIVNFSGIAEAADGVILSRGNLGLDFDPGTSPGKSAEAVCSWGDCHFCDGCSAVNSSSDIDYVPTQQKNTVDSIIMLIAM